MEAWTFINRERDTKMGRSARWGESKGRIAFSGMYDEMEILRDFINQHTDEAIIKAVKDYVGIKEEETANDSE